MHILKTVSILAGAAFIATAGAAGAADRNVEGTVSNDSAMSKDASPAAKPADKLICRQIRQSYTRQRDKVCLTKQQWEKVEQEQG